MTTTDKIVLVTGGFDPLHIGHIEYFKAARALGDTLIVGLNSDEWLTRKKGAPFMDWDNRAAIIQEIQCVDMVVSFDDSDNSACKAIEWILALFPDSPVIFANGGDRTQENIPEMGITDPRLSFEFGVGGENKMNSSSWILKNWEKQVQEKALTEIRGILTQSGDTFYNVGKVLDVINERLR